MIETYYGRFTDDRRQWTSEDHKRTPCPFLGDVGQKKVCTIYPVRPSGCRAFPFETDFGANGIVCPAAKEVELKLKKRAR